MKKRSVILSALLVIALCVCLISGATYALFTSESKVNIAVTSGKVQVEATVENLALYSMDRACPQYFENGGTASYDNGVLTLNKMTPGDKVTFDIKIVNKSNVDIQYKVSWEVSGDIAGGLVATADGKELSNVSWKESL